MKRFLVPFVIFLFYTIQIYPQDTIHVPADYQTIQEAINAASNGNIVIVDDGTYTENINFRGKAITVASRFFVNGDTNHINNTIIDGSQPVYPDSGSVVTLNSGEDTTSVLCGFTITGGTGTILQPGMVRGGGGITIGNAAAKICNNHIINNSVSDYNVVLGGGISSGGPGFFKFTIIEDNLIKSNFCSDGIMVTEAAGICIGSGGRVCNNIIQDNVASSSTGNFVGGGGLILVYGDSTIISGNHIFNNKALGLTIPGTGGGFWIALDSLAFIRFTNNIINNNEVEGYDWSAGAGGSIGRIGGGDALFANNIIYDNYYSGQNVCHGGGIYIYLTDIPLINNTITGNTAAYGGGISSHNTNSSVLINNIFWGNNAVISHTEIDIWTGNSPDFVYNDIQGGYPGTGNIGTDPQLNNLFGLYDTSPCIGAGIDSIEINGTWYYAPPHCFNGNPRPNPAGSMPDIGACESPLPTPIPVELTSFNAAVSGNEIILSWSTASELNNLGFEVQRSNDETEFAAVGFVDGHGTTTEQYTYSYVDRNLSNGTIYYRLKQLDFNGSYEYSNIIEVEWKNFNMFLLEQNYPNPFNPITTIGFGINEKVNVRISVFNSLGEEVSTIINREMEPGYHKTMFNAAGLPSGVYYYKIQAGEFISIKKMLLLK